MPFFPPFKMNNTVFPEQQNTWMCLMINTPSSLANPMLHLELDKKLLHTVVTEAFSLYILKSILRSPGRQIELRRQFGRFHPPSPQPAISATKS